MKTTRYKTLRLAFAATLLAFASAAFATPGNNGGGNGGCGVGQQTNGCGGTGTPTEQVLIPGPQGIQGLQGIQGIQGATGATGATGAAGADGKDGVGIAGKDGRDGIDGKDGKDGASVTGATGAAGKDGASIAGKDGSDGKDGATVKGDAGEKGATGQNAPDAVTQQQLSASVQAVQAQNALQLQSLREQVNQNAKAAYSGVAAALAIQMPALQPSRPEALTMRIGAGTYKGQSAVGISFRKGNKIGDWSVTGGVSATSQGTGVAVGIEHSF